MRHITRGLAAAALIAATTAAGTTTATADTESASGCSTWQYKVTEKAGIYRFPGSWQIGYAWKGYYVNATEHWISESGIDYKYGMIYNRDKKRAVSDHSFIQTSKLDYITCW